MVLGRSRMPVHRYGVAAHHEKPSLSVEQRRPLEGSYLSWVFATNPIHLDVARARMSSSVREVDGWCERQRAVLIFLGALNPSE